MLKLVCADLDARPLFWTEGKMRYGYEPEVAKAIADEMGEKLEWVFLRWADFKDYVLSGQADGILCGSAITPEREKVFLYSKPYACFNESVLIRSEDEMTKPEDFKGKVLGAIEGSTNMALAQQWPDIEYRAFSGNSDNVFWDMIHALENKEIDGVVDDEPAFGGVVENSSFKISFTIETKNMWGVALAPDNYKLKKRIDESLTKIQKNGKLKEIWRDFFSFQYPDDLRLQIEFMSHV